MKEKIVALIRLQNYDTQIQKILSRKKDGPLKLQKLDGALSNSRERNQDQADRLESIQKERRSIEEDIRDMEGKIAKSDIKLSQIKSNKEYQAALKEIEDVKNIKYEMEDRVLQFMEEIEDLEKKCSESQMELESLAKKIESAKKVIKKEISALDRELKVLTKERDDYSRDVDEELHKKYLFLRDRRGGQVIGPVIDGVCQSCHMGIPPQKYNELIGGNDLMSCSNCDRFIYWGDDEYYRNV